MLRAYFDDSGTHVGSDVVVVGGLVGTPQQWQEFDRNWAALLKQPLPGKPPIEKFHLAPCRARASQFRGYSEAEMDAVIHGFRQVIINAALIGTASAVEKKAWDELVIGPNRTEFGNALEICIVGCIEETFKIAGAHDDGEQIGITLDLGIKSPSVEARASKFTHPLGSPRLVSVNYQAVKDALGLQGADMVATETFWEVERLLKDPDGAVRRPHLTHYLGHVPAQAQIIYRAEIVEMLAKSNRARRQPGPLRDRVWMAPDFDRLPYEILAAMEGEGE